MAADWRKIYSCTGAAGQMTAALPLIVSVPRSGASLVVRAELQACAHKTMTALPRDSCSATLPQNSHPEHAKGEGSRLHLAPQSAQYLLHFSLASSLTFFLFFDRVFSSSLAIWERGRWQVKGTAECEVACEEMEVEVKVHLGGIDCIMITTALDPS